MTRLPVVYEDFGVFRLVAQRLCKAAVIFVGVREYDATKVGNRNPRCANPRNASIASFVFGPVSMIVNGSSAIR